MRRGYRFQVSPDIPPVARSGPQPRTPASPLAAQRPVTGQAGWTGWLDLRQSECVDRARRAMESRGVPVWWVDQWYVHGFFDGLFVSISCVADDGSRNLVSPSAIRMLVTVGVVRQVGSRITGDLRDALGAFMRGSAAPAAARPGGAGPAPVPPPTASTPATTMLQNGGTGPSFDGTAYRGKFFPSSPAGIITELCVYGSRARTSVIVEVKARDDASPALFQETIPIMNPNAWSCKSVSRPWSARSLFIYKVGGNGAIGYDRNAPHDSRYSSNRGAKWNTDRVRRGYRVAISREGG